VTCCRGAAGVNLKAANATVTQADANYEAAKEDLISLFRSAISPC